MNVETQNHQPLAPIRTTDGDKQVAVARVIAGSLAAGAVAAMVLTLAVFPGATESTITGSVLLAFGLGWALMAVVSVRMTSHPQRWAATPAAAMCVTGLGLLVGSPGDDTLTTLGWLWPPATVALVVWMNVSMRRALTGRGRLLLTAVFVVLAAASLGATAENITLHADQHAYTAPGASYDVGGHRLHIDCHGQGGPTVVLFNGLGEISASWSRITDQVGDTTRVCAYDRAGQGWSEDAPNAQDGVMAAADLHQLLDAAGEQGPYVLVGHSTGGPYSLTYAAQYPDQVAGMVLLDSSSPRQLTDIPSFAGQYVVMRRGLAMLPTVARLGMYGLFAPTPGLPGDAADQVHAMTSSPRAARNGRDEIAMVPLVFEQAQALTTLHDRPLVVLTASEMLETDGWAAAQDQLASLSSNHRHETVDSTHPGLVEDDHASAESVRAITDVVTAVRNGSSLATS